jgi:non-heme chloroperoxidase
MLTGLPTAYFQIKAFSETDMSEDLKKIDVPTLILHGDVDQIVPIGNAYRSSKLVPNATLKVYPGAPHAIISTSKGQVNEDLLNFVKVGQAPNHVPPSRISDHLAKTL